MPTAATAEALTEKEGATVPAATENDRPAPAETLPRYRENPKPPYPDVAKRRGWEGEVLVRLRVGADGTVLHVDLIRSSGYPILDRAAVKGVERWRFEPARRGGTAIESLVEIPIAFILKEG